MQQWDQAKQQSSRPPANEEPAQSFPQQRQHGTETEQGRERSYSLTNLESLNVERPSCINDCGALQLTVLTGLTRLRVSGNLTGVVNAVACKCQACQHAGQPAQVCLVQFGPIKFINGVACPWQVKLSISEAQP